MTERERLIEMIGSKVCEDYSPNCDEWQPHSCEKCYANDCRIGDLADYLLENGVIVPPCKVGDTVYVNPYTLGYLSFTDYEHCFIHSKHFVIAEVVSIIKTRKQNLIKLKIYNRTKERKVNRKAHRRIGVSVRR